MQQTDGEKVNVNVSDAAVLFLQCVLILNAALLIWHSRVMRIRIHLSSLLDQRLEDAKEVCLFTLKNLQSAMFIHIDCHAREPFSPLSLNIVLSHSTMTPTSTPVSLSSTCQLSLLDIAASPLLEP